jgi:hypothetical protein
MSRSIHALIKLQERGLAARRQGGPPSQWPAVTIDPAAFGYALATAKLLFLSLDETIQSRHHPC